LSFFNLEPFSHTAPRSVPTAKWLASLQSERDGGVELLGLAFDTHEENRRPFQRNQISGKSSAGINRRIARFTEFSKILKEMSAFLRSATRAVARPPAAATVTAAAARPFSSTAARPVARITIVGNLADTPELRASSTGREYLRYAVASNSGHGENRKTSWFNVSCFVDEGPRRDFYQSLPKGCVFCSFVSPFSTGRKGTRQPT
jgi:hypothetical protein